MTDAEYTTILENCNFGDPDAVTKLVSATYTDTKINERVRHKHLVTPDSDYNFLVGFFGTETWADGQGMSELREVYYEPRIPYSFTYFSKSAQVCDPNRVSCDFDYCEIPEGGRGNLPQMKMFEWGLQTKPHCIRGLRHIRAFREWAKRQYDTRLIADQSIMQMFYTMAVIQTTGHKMVLEAVKNASGQLVPKTSTSPRNPLGQYSYSYGEELFPHVTDPQNIVPLDMDTLRRLARRWTLFNKDYSVARGPRGEHIFEFWYPEDWYNQEVLSNPDHVENLRYHMPAKNFAGYSLDPGQREVIENWAMRPMPQLPRFSQTIEGHIVPVDMHEDVEVEIGYEPVPNQNWIDAPILMAMAPSPQQGVIMRRPDLMTDAVGNSIMPIMGSGDWRIRNEYDKECNKHRNKPHAEKNYELGFRMEDPNAGFGVLFRARRYHVTPINDCDLQPMFNVDPKDISCDDPTYIGCDHVRSPQQASITEIDFGSYIDCSFLACGPENNDGDSLYRLWPEWKNFTSPDFNPFDCACGSTVSLAIHGDDGQFLRLQDGVIEELLPHNESAKPVAWVRTATLADAECIKRVLCQDATPTCGVGDIDLAHDDETAGVNFILDSVVGSAEVGDNVAVRYRDSDDADLDLVIGTIAEYNPATNLYRITSGDADLTADGPAGTETVQICTTGS